MSIPILVTGATGFLGNNVVRALCDQGYMVRAFVRKGYDERCFRRLELDYVTGDLRNADDVRVACDGTCGVIHCAGVVQIGWSDNQGHEQINVRGTQHVVDAVCEAGIPLVHVSTVNSLPFGRRPRLACGTTPYTGEEVPCNYVLSKRSADQQVLSRIGSAIKTVGNSGDRWKATIVYPGFMLGPWDWKPSSGRMLQQLARGKAVLAPRGGCSVCDVRDVASGIVTCLGRGLPGERYILAGHNVTYLELWQEMAAVIGVRQPRGTFGPVVSGVAGFVGDLVGRIQRREAVVNSATVQMSNRFHYYCSTLAERDLGYQVRPWQESVRDSWQWICENG